METSIRVGVTPFYAESEFPFGLARSSYFNKRESLELTTYGTTFQNLQLGLLTPINAEEQQFIMDLNSPETSELYSVKLWQKYLNATQKSKVFHGFNFSERLHSNEVTEADINATEASLSM
ncbi:DUF413 domain-containing protein [Colwellia sp. E2M01]|uniref:DUF413 domain-containing protein n=1 Tax=Colwellia sp. E2M01 TaxID=2841561 RepID=UPI001C081921|nr:DUF413 domain-containing protein [Colwellia sp. E2M01]MBU2869872.1 DUF413 domain-containing protein [Colwellia sp. E2M01]